MGINVRLSACCLWIIGIFVCTQSALAALTSGDRVKVTSGIGVKVRDSAGGTAYAVGQTQGALGVITGKAKDAQINGIGLVYTWWFVDFDSGTDGWVATIGFDVIVPDPPRLLSPGDSQTVPIIQTTNPEFKWNAVKGANGYGLYVQQGDSLVYDDDNVKDVTSITLPPGTIKEGKSYIWNMRARNSAGYSAFSKGDTGRFYFQTKAGETVSAPGVVTGEPNPNVGTTYQYTVGSSTSSLGHTIEYSFDWGDGSKSEFSTSTTASHFWSSVGSQVVIVTARCREHPDISANNLPGNFVEVRSVAPNPVLVSVAGVPDKIEVGKAFTVTITANNTGGLGEQYSAINSSVAFSDGSDDLSIGNVSAPWADNVYSFNIGMSIRDNTCTSISASDHLIETVDNAWGNGEEHIMSYTVTPAKEGILLVRVRVTLRNGSSGCVYANDTSAAGGETSIDQQGWTVRQFATVVTPPLFPLTVAVFGVGDFTLDPPGGSYPVGTRVTITARPGDNYQVSEIKGPKYSRDDVMWFQKGGGDETIEVHFVPRLLPTSMNTAVAHSTPSVIGISSPLTPNWITICENTTDFCAWTICRIIHGIGQPALAEYSTIGPLQFFRTSKYPEVTTPPFLRFPITNGATPWTAPISAIMDHQRSKPAISPSLVTDKDCAIRTLNGDTYVVQLGDRGIGENFARLNDDQNPPSSINYRGVGLDGTYSSTSQGGARAIQYDGHVGYDYKYASANVHSCAPGRTITDDDLAGTNLAGTGIVAKYMSCYHAVIVMHEGYCTIYMHLSSIDPDYVDRSDDNSWKPKSHSVDMDKPIGKTGNFTCSGENREHLHFEVWRLDGKEWNYADPYGIQGRDGTAVVDISPSLWIK